MGCTHDCDSCSSSCGGDSADAKSLVLECNSYSCVKKVIGVVSGKGGVGKSMVTAMLATAANRIYPQRVAVLDADVTGPSVPRMFGIKDRAVGSEQGIFPCTSETGIEVMSVNLLLENETDPVVWRGPVIAGTVKQFWQDVIWGDIEYMFVDMPPGTGDVPLTVFQSLPVDGIIIVTSPQELVSMIVEKAVKMVEMMNIPVLGIVENMSYFKCPECGKKHKIFRDSHIEEVVERRNTRLLATLPLDPELAHLADCGRIEMFDGGEFDEDFFKTLLS